MSLNFIFIAFGYLRRLPPILPMLNYARSRVCSLSL